jgi:hypothetical protein
MKIKTIFRILIIFLILIMCTNIGVYAVSGGDYTNAYQFESYTAETNVIGTNKTAEEIAVNALSFILGLLRNIALGWAFIMCMVIGLKYMISKPQVKASLKMDLPTYFIGASLLFGASGLMTLLKYFVDDVIVI